VGRLEGALDNSVTEGGKIVVVKAGLDWQVLATHDLDEQSYATPALSARQVVIRTGSSLWKFGVQ
jgi:hypothetical protein